MINGQAITGYLSQDNIDKITKYFDTLEEELQDSDNKYSLEDY